MRHQQPRPMQTLRLLLRWLGEWLPLLAALAACYVAIGIVIVFMQCGSTAVDRAARWSGLALQLAAFVMAAVALAQARVLFGRASIAKTVATWWSRRPWTPQRGATASLNATLDGATFSGRMYSWATTDATLRNEQRITNLEQQIGTLHLLWQEDSKLQTNHIRQINEQLREECSNVLAEISTARATLEKFAVGDVATAAAALLCAVVGTLLGGIATDLAALAK